MPRPPKDPRERAIWYARRAGLTLLGSAALAGGVIMLITPGPAFLLIPLGLTLLGSAGFAWAQRAELQARRQARKLAQRARERNEARHRPPRVDVPDDGPHAPRVDLPEGKRQGPRVDVPENGQQQRPVH